MKKSLEDIIILQIFTINYSHMIWFFRYRVQQTIFFVILDRLLSFYPSNNSKNQNFEKLTKAPGDIIILHKCTKNHDHMLSLDMARNEFNCYFSFLASFCPFRPPTAQKIKIFKTWKKCLEISSFYICVPKIMTRWYTVLEIWCATDGQTDGQMDRQMGNFQNTKVNQNER